MDMNANMYKQDSGLASVPVLLDKLISLVALLLCSAALAVCRYRLLLTGLGSTLCAAMTACFFALLVVLALLSRRKFAPLLRSGCPSVTFGASAAAFLLLLATAVSVYFAMLAPVADRVTDENAAVSFLMNVFALLSAVYFFLASAWTALPERKSLHLLLSMAPILFCALRILNTFINTSTLPLASSGGYHILGMIAAMLFFLNEGKLLVGTKNTSAYLVTGYAAVLFCAAYDVPLLIYSIREGGAVTDAAYSLLTLGLAIYILTRIASLPARRENDQETF